MENCKPHRKIKVRPYLTYRQKQCLKLLSEGLTSSAIALELGISIRMVREHLRNAKVKLNAYSTTQAAVIASKWGLLEEG